MSKKDMTPALSQFKSEVLKLEHILKKFNIDINHSGVLEVWSQFKDYANWQTAQADLSKNNIAQEVDKIDETKPRDSLLMSKRNIEVFQELLKDIRNPNFKLEGYFPSGVLPKIVPYISIFMFDEPSLLDKHPNGFHTETSLFLPNHWFNYLTRENADVKKNLFLKIMTGVIDILETCNYVILHSYQRKQALSDLFLKPESLSRMPYDTMPLRTDFVTSSQLMFEAIGCGVSLEKAQDLGTLNADVYVIDYLLLQSNELHDGNHPFNAFAPAIESRINFDNGLRHEDMQKDDGVYYNFSPRITTKTKM